MDNPYRTPARGDSSSVSIMQDWLLQLVRLKPAVPIHTTAALELIGPLCRRSLRAALDHIVHRHEVLRTVFRQIDRVSMAFVGPADRGLALLDQDVGSEHEALCLLREETRAPFDVGTGPLIRARLLRLSTTRCFLLVSVHPLVCDRASLRSILKELRDLYDAFSNAAAIMLLPPTQYADYTLQQLGTLTPAVLQQQLGYWKRQLLGARDLAHLPTNRPRRATQLYSMHRHRLDLSAKLTGGLNKLAARSGGSLLAMLLAGWGALLNRWSGQDDLIIGVWVSDRPPAGSDYVIGPFENVLPLRVSIPPSITVAALLGQIDATLAAANANKDIPIHAIGESLRPLRDGRPILQSAIALSHTSLEAAVGGAFSAGALQVATVWEERSESTLEISLSLSFTEGRLVAVVEYAEELFEKSTIERVCGWWTTLLSAMVKTPEWKVGRLPMLTDADRDAVFGVFNHACSSCEPPQRIDEALEICAQITPDAPAVVDGARTLSYRELNGISNQLACVLRRRGVRCGELIALLLDRSMEAIVAALAVLKAGAAYVAVSPTEFRENGLRMPPEHAPRLFIVAQRAQSASCVNDEQIIAFDTDAGAISAESTENVQKRGVRACDLACVVLGAESAGQSRWMLLEHRNVTSMMASLDERLHFTRFDVWSWSHSLSSRIAVMELWGALLCGSQVTVVRAGVTRDPQVWCEFLARSGITVLNQKPSEFLRWSGASRLTRRHQLHTLILSGEPLRAPALKAWFDVGRCWPQIIYLYGHRGPTLASAYSKVTQAHVLRRSGNGLAGVPLSCARVYILDRYRRPVPIGVVGAIYVAGGSVARGYIGNPRRGECITGSSGMDPDSMLYKTGDQGMWTAEGHIELVSPEVATSSLNAEACRIESELLSHPAVRHASVAVTRNAAGGDSFVAYVEGMRWTLSAAELRSYLESNIPAYMMPKQFFCGTRPAAWD